MRSGWDYSRNQFIDFINSLNNRHTEMDCDDNDCDGDDRISNLPDCILHHILSFLPTKDSVATCILSTRWKHLWTCVPNIDLDDELLYSNRVNAWFRLEVTCFVDFVERVLLLHEVPNIKKFRLSCRVCFSASRVHAWVSSAIKHNVQELDLCLLVGKPKPCMLPSCFFHSESLTVVKIEMNCLLELPVSISFPCLKTLHLFLVKFPSDSSTQKLFSSCPVLEDLVLLDCNWMNLESERIKISIPTLKSLTLDDLGGCEVNVEGASLMFLKYMGCLSNGIFLHDVPSLISASVEIPFRHVWQQENTYQAINLLRGLHSVNSIRISNGIVESVFSSDRMLVLLPIFGNLTQLELSMQSKFQTIKALMKLVQFSPNLHTICFSEGLDAHMHIDEDDSISPSVPKCLLSSIKKINFGKFCGSHAEISLVKFLLRHSTVLERLVVYFSKILAGDTDKLEDTKNKLQLLSKSSRHCQITFF